MLLKNIFHYMQDDQLFIDNDCYLSLLNVNHATEFFSVIDANRRRIEPWCGWVTTCLSIHAAESFIRFNLECYNNGSGMELAILMSGKIIGGVSYYATDWQKKICNLGYWISEDYQGKGIVTRACYALVAHAFNALLLKQIFIHCAVDNVKSRAIPTRLFFEENKEPFIFYENMKNSVRSILMIEYIMNYNLWRRLFKERKLLIFQYLEKPIAI